MYDRPTTLDAFAGDSFNAAVHGRGEPSAATLEQLLEGLPLTHRRLKRRQYVFRAGQPRHGLYLIHSGFFKTRVISEDGREKVTGFRLRGDLLGLEALDLPHYPCDA